MVSGALDRSHGNSWAVIQKARQRNGAQDQIDYASPEESLSASPVPPGGLTSLSVSPDGDGGLIVIFSDSKREWRFIFGLLNASALI